MSVKRHGKNFDVMRTADWVSDKTFNGETVARPFFNGANPDQFVVFFTLDVTPKATGQRTLLEEVAVYHARAILLRRRAVVL